MFFSPHALRHECNDPLSAYSAPTSAHSSLHVLRAYECTLFFPRIPCLRVRCSAQRTLHSYDVFNALIVQYTRDKMKVMIKKRITSARYIERFWDNLNKKERGISCPCPSNSAPGLIRVLLGAHNALLNYLRVSNPLIT